MFFSSLDDKERQPRTRNSSQSESKGKSNRRSDSSSSKSKEKSESFISGNSEKLHRDNMRKCLREILITRMGEMTKEEQREVNDGPYNPKSLASRLEEELCKAHGGATNPKCKSKYRSIFFNLK